ncbi:MAG: cytidine deaminase [Candidatus Atribacteria bacterium]|nr:cytidine deaminase [Candidatus Atribacteria bacterium]
MKKLLISKLIEKAKEARLKAYSPYSKFSVGAAIMTDNGTIFTGCNIENQSLGLSICAERVAIFKAISEGYRKFKALAIVVDTKNPCSPCGACRQVMAEFSVEMDVIMANLQNEIEIRKVKDLIPDVFQGLTKSH